jgi:hypothetical protein
MTLAKAHYIGGLYGAVMHPQTLNSTVKATIMAKLTLKYPAKILDNAQLNKMVDGAVKGLTQSRNSVQVLLVSMLMHTHRHGDRSAMERLIASIGTEDNADKMNRKRIVSYLVEFAGLVYDDETGTFTGWQGADHIKDNFQRAKDTAWWSFHKPAKREVKAFDINQAIADLVKKALYHKKQGYALLKLDDASINSILSVCGIDSAIKFNYEPDEMGDDELHRLLAEACEADEIAEAIASGDYEAEAIAA